MTKVTVFLKRSSEDCSSSGDVRREFDQRQRLIKDRGDFFFFDTTAYSVPDVDPAGIRVFGRAQRLCAPGIREGTRQTGKPCDSRHRSNDPSHADPPEFCNKGL
jgi:hypothetical protein